jgi:hypothetical protein
VGRCETRGVDRIVDVAGKTIIPGWVDTHSHQLSVESVGEGVIPQHRWTSASYIAYGVTTTHDPGVEESDGTFSIGELTEAGRITGPRTFSAGEYVRPFGGMQMIESYKDAQEIIDRFADRGVLSAKSYQLSTRVQRQMLSEAARAKHMTVTGENQGLEFNLGFVMDGHAGWEHWLQYVPLYSDVARFFGAAGAHYSGQLYIAGYPHASTVTYWLGQTHPWDDPKQQRFTPWARLAQRRVYSDRPISQFSFPILAEGAKDIVNAGGYYTIGGHAEEPGLDMHWEVWSFASAAGPMMALEAASMGGAHFLGLDHELGSIAVGKIADLAVLDRNPLVDIRATSSIRYTMKDGKLYDAGTADELWPRRQPYGERPWAIDDAFRHDVRPNAVFDAVPADRRPH